MFFMMRQAAYPQSAEQKHRWPSSSFSLFISPTAFFTQQRHNKVSCETPHHQMKSYCHAVIALSPQWEQ